MTEKCIVIPEWLYQDQTNLDKPIINKIEYTNKEKLIEDIKKGD